jgi:hypothetical protein
MRCFEASPKTDLVPKPLIFKDSLELYLDLPSMNYSLL